MESKSKEFKRQLLKLSILAFILIVGLGIFMRTNYNYEKNFIQDIQK